MTLDELYSLIAQSKVGNETPIGYQDIVSAIQSQYTPQQFLDQQSGAGQYISGEYIKQPEFVAYGRQQQNAAPIFTPGEFVAPVTEDLTNGSSVSSDTSSSGAGENPLGDSGSQSGTIGQGISNDVIDASLNLLAISENPVAKAISLVTGIPITTIASALGKAGADAQISNISEAFDALGQDTLGGQNALVSDESGNVFTISNQDIIDAYDAATFGPSAMDVAAEEANAANAESNYGSMGMDGYSDGSDGGYSGGSDGIGGGYSDGSDGGYWAKGGMVTQNRLIGPDPKGQDTGYGGLQDGEFVIKKSSVEKYGDEFLSLLNSGKLSKKKVMSLL